MQPSATFRAWGWGCTSAGRSRSGTVASCGPRAPVKIVGQVCDCGCRANRLRSGPPAVMADAAGRVLVVEDDDSVALVLAGRLEDEDFEVKHPATARAGLAR